MSNSRVPAARNALEILRLLSTIDVPISAARIRSELDLPRSSTYHLLKEMVDAGFVVHLPENQTYGLGLAAYSMAAAYATQQPLVRATQGHLERIASKVDGSGHLSRLAGSEILYLNEVRAPKAMSLVTERGVRLQAQRTASGRAMLAVLPEAEWRAAYSAGALSFGEFKTILRDVRERGWAEEVEVVARGQASVGVAIVDHVGRPAAALAVTYPVGTADAAAVAHELKAAAAQVAKRMYGRR
ncbi:IclR family transcriptional regulator [Corynebacterium minutissimum]|uniref:IclR family transcriptional regulator n=1 Tax=Corynebacterium minutissimum TaxID=38301 RepID=A0A376CX82_9CORY|nr:IclR family transcriptional regulator [Corynebacterium minutissimum]QRP60741.1 IclR family transcriptional regulator [Corynebacterium minutissimum]STC77015.1 IclR family transcriptional regulator [Corynebacterium minutissimum]